MGSSRRWPTVGVMLLAASLVWQPACAPKAPPSAAPAPTPPAAAPLLRPPGPAPSSGTGAGVYQPAPAPLLGHVTRDQVRAYAPWQPLFVEPYRPDPAAIATIKANAGGVMVLLVMGTWCPDSRREMPRFFSIMDAAGLGDATLTMVGVDRTKKDAEGLTERWGITRVPTFVVLRNGQEIGRVIERTPAGSTLEAEIARVLAPKS